MKHVGTVLICALFAAACGASAETPATPESPMTPASDIDREYEYETPGGDEVEVETEIDHGEVQTEIDHDD